MLFDLAEPLDYVVEAAGVRSPSHKLNVVELPYAKKIDLEYTYPSYTGLEPRKIEDGGDVAVLKGTDVKLTITPTMASKGGAWCSATTRACRSRPTPTARCRRSSRPQHDGFYRVELDAPNGERLTASPQYTVDLLSDLAPTVKLSKPGRDTDATPVEEFFVEARADDDYAVKNLQLVYSGQRRSREGDPALSAARGRSAEVTAGHTFYMEELGVKAGDSVSYFARATDNDAVNGAKQTSSDIYFLRIRPFDKNFKPAASMAGGGGGGGGGGQEVGALSQQQRQIISGTFNIQRDRKTMTAAKFREGMVVLTLAQSKLRDQVNGLVERMNSRLVVSDPSFKKIAELLPKAAEQMTRGREEAAGAESRRRAAAREHGAAVPAAGGRGIRAAGADRPPGRRRWWRRRRRFDRRMTWPTCSRWKWTRWRTSTRPTRRPPRSSRISRSTSSPRS